MMDPHITRKDGVWESDRVCDMSPLDRTNFNKGPGGDVFVNP